MRNRRNRPFGGCSVFCVKSVLFGLRPRSNFAHFRSRVPPRPPNTHSNCTAAPACGRGSQASNFDPLGLFPLIRGQRPGHLRDKKTPTLLGTPLDPRHRPTVGSLGGAFSCKRGTPVDPSLRGEGCVAAVLASIKVSLDQVQENLAPKEKYKTNVAVARYTP